MIKVIMFDLDGTLLPMNQDSFVKAYFGGLAKKIEPFGFKPEEVVNAVTKGVGAMIKNDGTLTHEEVFWNKFSELLGEGIKEHKDLFEDYYKNEFQQVRNVCGFDERARKAVEIAKEKGFRVALATSPMFPKIATESRMSWAGFKPTDFEIYSTYEDYSFCKPNLNYYKAVIESLDVLPEECVMVGNDVLEDMVAKELGVEVFLLTDNLINRKDKDFSEYNQGGFDELIEYLKSL